MNYTLNKNSFSVFKSSLSKLWSVVRITGLLSLLFAIYSNQAWSEDWIYRLHEGENLTLVKERFLKPEFTPEQLQVFNGIEEDREIPVGTEIRVPIDWMKDQLAGVEVNYVFGEATVARRGSSISEVVEAGDILKAGDLIITGARSAVSLLFADKSVLLVGESSEVLFDALSSYEGIGMLDTRIRLQRGRVESRVTPFKRPESRYEIYTPAAVTVVRGTDFRISAIESDDLTRSEVTDGEVEVKAQGASVFVKEGEGTLVKSGEVPSEPRRLLPEPDMSQLSIEKNADALLLKWPELIEAVSYRYQLKDQDQVLLSTGVTQSHQVKIPLITTGEYALFLRGIDALGFEGMEGEKLFHLDVEPANQRPSTPVQKRKAPTMKQPKFFHQGVAFEWTEVSGAWAYRFILARDQALNDVLFERLSFDQGFHARTPGPGRYYAAVEALIEGGEGMFLSDIFILEIPGWY